MELEPKAELQANQVIPTEGASSTSTATEPRKVSALECHLCFKPPTDPVATSCGHVFCWPCMHHWFQDDPNEKPCPACGTPLNLDLSILTLYANASGIISGPTTTASQNVIIPGRPSTPLTFIDDLIGKGRCWKTPVSGAAKVTLLLGELRGKKYTKNGQPISMFKTGDANKVPSWLVELLQRTFTEPVHISEEEARMEQEVKDLKQQKAALKEELDQQLQVERELEQQLIHRLQARSMKARV